MFLRIKSVYQKSQISILMIKGLLLLGTLLVAWFMAGGEARAAGPGQLARPGLIEQSPVPIITNEPTIVTTTALTGTLLPPSAQTVCPVVEPTGRGTHPKSLVSSILQTATALAGTFQPSSTFKERVNILLLGSDSRPGEKYGRTDTMILVTVDPLAKTAGLLSIPRDLWVAIPGYGEARINQAHRIGGVEDYPGGGAALTVATVESNLGVTVHYYALVDFEGFEQIVDLLHGIDICVPETIDAASYYGYVPEYINKVEYYSYLSASPEGTTQASVTTNPPLNPETAGSSLDTGYKFLYIEAGFHTLNGEAALSYARSRASITADFARVQRQQTVLLAIKNKVLQMETVPKLPELWEAMGQMAETNLTLVEALQLVQLAYEIDPAHIQVAAIGHDQTISYRTSSGAAVLLPKRAEIKALVEQMAGSSNPTAPLTQAELEATQKVAQVGPAS